MYSRAYDGLTCAPRPALDGEGPGPAPLRMAKMTLVPAPDSPDDLLRAIRARWRELQALPWIDRPEAAGHHGASARYLALEADMRALTDRYRELARASSEAGSEA